MFKTRLSVMWKDWALPLHISWDNSGSLKAGYAWFCVDIHVFFVELRITGSMKAYVAGEQ